jgi:hypothetical protein
MNYDLICYLETLKVLLLILCSLARNTRDVTAKQMDGAVPIYDPMYYEKYFPQKHLSTLVQGLFPFFHKSDDGKYFFP